VHVYRPRFYPMIAPGYPQPTNATREKWFRSIFHFLAGCHPATSAAPDVWLPKRYGRIGERRCSLIILPEGAVQRERAGRT
jgi:hypothetical protein